MAQDDSHESSHKHKCPVMDSASMKEWTHTFNDFDMGEFPFHKKHKKYNGHWAGFELGMGGYVNSGFSMNFSPAYPYMNMNTARSLMVNFNLFELNLNLCQNHIGFTTGLGFQVSNYYFTDNYVMLKDSSTIVAYKVQDKYGNPVSLETNKLVVSYINIPLIFEYQTNPYRKMSSFHAGLGIIAGARIGSYTKQVYSAHSETYFLVDDKGNQVAMFDVNDHKVRTRGPYHLSPFKIDATVRIGWSRLNLFGTYSLTQMFQSGTGPEVYPFSVGITLLGW